MNFICGVCQKEYPISGLAYRCSCGGLFQLKQEKPVGLAMRVSLGEVQTPVISREFSGVKLQLKLDYLLPTGSFKDRGAAFLINALKEAGITSIVEDSSGNAGASVAAYAAAAGMHCRIYVSCSTSEGKVRQIKAYGAEVVKVPGNRDDTAQAIQTAAAGNYYASHVYNPLFFAGIKALASELVGQIGCPDCLYIPVGNGSLLLGLYQGFLELDRMPRLIGIQSENCAPIYHRYYGLTEPKFAETLAEGIAVRNPARAEEIIQAIKKSGGDMVLVNEGEISRYHQLLGLTGIFVEPTSAAAVAGAVQFCLKHPWAKQASGVVVLTGMGLKAVK